MSNTGLSGAEQELRDNIVSSIELQLASSEIYNTAPSYPGDIVFLRSTGFAGEINIAYQRLLRWQFSTEAFTHVAMMLLNGIIAHSVPKFSSHSEFIEKYIEPHGVGFTAGVIFDYLPATGYISRLDQQKPAAERYRVFRNKALSADSNLMARLVERARYYMGLKYNYLIDKKPDPVTRENSRFYMHCSEFIHRIYSDVVGPITPLPDARVLPLDIFLSVSNSSEWLDVSDEYAHDLFDNQFCEMQAATEVKNQISFALMSTKQAAVMVDVATKVKKMSDIFKSVSATGIGQVSPEDIERLRSRTTALVELKHTYRALTAGSSIAREIGKIHISSEVAKKASDYLDREIIDAAKYSFRTNVTHAVRCVLAAQALHSALSSKAPTTQATAWLDILRAYARYWSIWKLEELEQALRVFQRLSAAHARTCHEHVRLSTGLFCVLAIATSQLHVLPELDAIAETGDLEGAKTFLGRVSDNATKQYQVLAGLLQIGAHQGSFLSEDFKLDLSSVGL